MRIKEHEYQDILKAIDKAGFGILDFDFVKKKGWFHLIPKSGSGFFSFHRQLSTEIVDGNFQDKLLYRIKSNTQIQETETWERTLIKLNNWLEQGIT